MSFGNEPISAMTTQNNPSDLQHHDLVQDALCAPALMAPMVASKSIDSFLDPPTVMGLKPSGHLQQATYTMSAEHSQLDGSISNFPQLVLPEAAGSPDISRNNIPQVRSINLILHQKLTAERRTRYTHSPLSRLIHLPFEYPPNLISHTMAHLRATLISLLTLLFPQQSGSTMAMREITTATSFGHLI